MSPGIPLKQSADTFLTSLRLSFRSLIKAHNLGRFDRPIIFELRGIEYLFTMLI